MRTLMVLRLLLASAMGRNSRRLNITVPQDDYEEWQDAIEDGVQPSFSKLIRKSVRSHLDGGQEPQTAVEGGPSEEVLRYLQQIDSTLEGVEERLERLESEARASSESGAVDLQKVAFELLPVVALPERVECEAVEASDAVTAKDVANRIEASTGEVLEALISLKPRDPEVCSKDCDGTIYWWREIQ